MSTAEATRSCKLVQLVSNGCNVTQYPLHALLTVPEEARSTLCLSETILRPAGQGDVIACRLSDDCFVLDRDTTLGASTTSAACEITLLQAYKAGELCAAASN